jgi:hypothetical protein
MTSFGSQAARAGLMQSNATLVSVCAKRSL